MLKFSSAFSDVVHQRNRQVFRILYPLVAQSTVVTAKKDTPLTAARRGAVVVGIPAGIISLLTYAKYPPKKFPFRAGVVNPLIWTAGGAMAGLLGHGMGKGYHYVRSKLK